MRYSSVEEGELTAERVAAVPEDVDRGRVRFAQARFKGRGCQGGRCLPKHRYGAVLELGWAPAFVHQHCVPLESGRARTTKRGPRACMSCEQGCNGPDLAPLGYHPPAGRCMQPAGGPGTGGCR